MVAFGRKGLIRGIKGVGNIWVIGDVWIIGGRRGSGRALGVGTKSN